MDIRIENANAADLPALVALLGGLFSIEQDFVADEVRQHQGLELLLADPGRACVLVARDAGRVVGMVSAQLVVSTAEGAFSAWIEDVVVDAPHRGKGVGPRLLQAVLQWARAHGATRAQLLADVGNTPALDFYARQGWERTRLGAWRIRLIPQG